MLLVAAGCVAQQMDEKNDTALRVTIYTPHSLGVTQERRGNPLLGSVWSLVPFITENYDHTNKFFGIFIELHGNNQVTNRGTGGLMFTVDGKKVVLSRAILARSRRQPSCGLGRCTVTWTIAPKTPAEQAALVQLIKTVASGHAVYATLFPSDTGGGQRFIALLTEEQLLAFHDVLQYYESLALTKRVVLTSSAE
jgi:hypothetical protein